MSKKPANTLFTYKKLLKFIAFSIQIIEKKKRRKFCNLFLIFASRVKTPLMIEYKDI